ncbi:glyoxalase [Taibaiella sp. KBW10]|uniref:VOC family protein n=1 Tax=Taibaiella sp. KBW10 TaxID=2153357 RepID=UPI000F5A20B6|nr:VOC family protein [Taibaiella sp. KBW10]RQO30786.1 glyoxalase [Taibaiella sp. KBW10]
MAGFNPVHWFEIYVDDMDRARKFYETVLAQPMTEMKTPEGMPMQMLGFPSVLEGEGTSGALVKMEGVKSGGSATLVYFSCEDCALEQSRVVAAGGTIMQAKFSIGEYGFCAVCCDTEGNCFGLFSMS